MALKKVLFWAALVCLVVISMWFAIRADDLSLQWDWLPDGISRWSMTDKDAVREMATGAFGGGIVGAVILAYEQLRDDQREGRADRRAGQIRGVEEAAENKRLLTTVVVNELAPAIENFVNHASDWTSINGPCPDFQETRSGIPSSISQCTRLVQLVDDQTATSCFEAFCAAFRTFKDNVFESSELPWHINPSMQVDRTLTDSEGNVHKWTIANASAIEDEADSVHMALDTLFNCALSVELPEIET